MQYVQLLRYGPVHLREPGKVFAKLACIAKMLKISVQKVRCLLQPRSSGKAIITGLEGRPRQKLSDEHK